MEWGYKSTATNFDFAGTKMLARRGILLRSAFNDGDSHRAANVASVGVGDVLHFYVVDRSKARAVGRFEIVRPEDHPSPAAFGERVEGTALYRIADDALVRTIDTQGAYQHDMTLGCFTAWILKHVGPQCRTKRSGSRTWVR